MRRDGFVPADTVMPYLDGRSIGNNMSRYGLQLGFDAASNILKEFWPDLKRGLPGRFVPR